MSPISYEQAVAILRNSSPKVAEAAYLEENISIAARRYSESAEFKYLLRILKSFKIQPKNTLELGAGHGILGFALALNEHKVIALDSNLSNQVGLEAILDIVKNNPNLTLIPVLSLAQNIPLASSSIDLIVCRQFLHHIHDLKEVAKEIKRVLRPKGIFVALREHVAESQQELTNFLECHPLHKHTQEEHAYPVSHYVKSLTSEGLKLRAMFKPFDNVINSFPVTDQNIKEWLKQSLCKIVGERVAGKLSQVSLLQYLYRRWLNFNHVSGGRMYSFILSKP